MTAVTIPWRFEGADRAVTVQLDVPDGVADDAPLIVLLHGNGGDVNDMSDPAVHPGFNYERIVEGTVRDRGWHAYPNVGYWSIGFDALTAVEGWAPWLRRQGYPVLYYSQVDPTGLLPRPAAELRAILEAIEATGTGAVGGLDAVKDRRIVLVGHSRGGLLARQVLVDLADAASPVLDRISTLITLHSPHQGSTLANVAIALAPEIARLRLLLSNASPVTVAQATVVLRDIVAMIDAQVSAPSYQDLALGSPRLAAIAAKEPVPGIDYFTFGGTRSTLLNVRGWAFLPGSAIMQWHMPPFRWTTAYQTIVPLPPPHMFFPLVPEIQPGLGDVLTAAARTRLPFSTHLDNHLNHSEALWDDLLKIQVRTILRGSALPKPLVVTCATPDSTDADRRIDALGGPDPAGGTWRLSIDDVLRVMDLGQPVYVRSARGGLSPLQRVRRQDGTRYLRARPGAGATRLSDLPRCR